MFGGNGNDNICGYFGSDYFTGGAGADFFNLFYDVKMGDMDLIFDLSAGDYVLLPKCLRERLRVLRIRAAMPMATSAARQAPTICSAFRGLTAAELELSDVLFLIQTQPWAKISSSPSSKIKHGAGC